MKVLKNNKDDCNKKKIEFPIEHECQNCGSILEVLDCDIEEGFLGQAYVICPICNKKSFLEIDELDNEITVDNLVFPKHFYYFGDTDAAKLTNDEIKKFIKDGINFFRNNPENYCYTTGTGDTIVFVLNYPGDENYIVYVCKGYYETEIRYTNDDYKIGMYDKWKNKGVNKK